MLKILSISNSFGEDATRYLYGLARSEGEDIKIVTLYIGGCSLERHCRNILSDASEYLLCVNGMRSGFYVSIKEALLSDEWDVVVLQQASPVSANAESYHPYISELSKYVRDYAPTAKQLVHMTWSYPQGSEWFNKTGRYTERGEMIEDIRACYKNAAETIDARIIPSLDAMNRLYDAIGTGAYRDGGHASYGVGRYMLSCVWYMCLLGKNIINSYRDFDVDVSEAEAVLAESIARETLERYALPLI